MDVEACCAGHDASFILGGHGVPASVFLHGRLDDHAQVATVVLVHAGKKIQLIYCPFFGAQSIRSRSRAVLHALCT